MEILLENSTTNETGNPVSVASGGYRIVRFRGTFDGATVTIECDFGDNQFVPADDNGRTTPGVLYLSLAQGMRIRATVTSAGASTDITVDFL